MSSARINSHLNTVVSTNGRRSDVGAHKSPNGRRSNAERSPTNGRRLSLSLSPQRASEPEYAISDEMLRTAEKSLSFVNRKRSETSVSPNSRRFDNLYDDSTTVTSLTTASPTQIGARYFNDLYSQTGEAYTDGHLTDVYVREAIQTFEARRNAMCAAESFSKVYAMREDDIVRAMTPNARAAAAAGMLSTEYVYMCVHGVCTCVPVCVCVRARACVLYVYVCLCVYVYIVYTCVYACMYACILCMYVHVHAIRVYAFYMTHIYVYSIIHTCIVTYIDT
jgi:hypothetical protein